MHIGVTVYAKTTKGRLEIDGRTNGLSAKERRVLILVDARRSPAEIGVTTGLRQAVESVLSRLREGGFIESINGVSASIRTNTRAISAPLSSTEQRKTGPERPVDVEALNQAKQIMTTASRQHLGLFGMDLERRIDAAKSPESLASCIAKWNMAMRESLSGRRCVDECIGRIQMLLSQEPG